MIVTIRPKVECACISFFPANHTQMHENENRIIHYRIHIRQYKRIKRKMKNYKRATKEMKKTHARMTN